MWTAKGDEFYAEYEHFYIDDEPLDYTLHVDGYHGNAGEYVMRGSMRTIAMFIVRGFI